MAVAREELPDPQRAGGVIRADEHDVAEPARDQLDAAQDERAHQDLAELGVGLHERQQLVAIELDHFARPRGPVRGPATRRPESMFTSPVNWPGPCTVMSVSPVRDGRTISICPAVTTKNGTSDGRPRTAPRPRRLAARVPCAATRAICAGVSVGNTRSARSPGSGKSDGRLLGSHRRILVELENTGRLAPECQQPALYKSVRNGASHASASWA